MPHLDRRLFAGPGEVRALLRARDWSGFPIGPPETWPAAIQTAVQLMLDSPQPLVLYIGAQLNWLYNDAYLSMAGDKHPASLARTFDEAWPELADSLGPLLRSALAGQVHSFQDRLVTVNRHGALEEMYADFSFVPLRDPAGEVLGVLVPCAETTQEVANQQRVAYLQSLADRLYPLTAPAEVSAAACELLGRHLAATRVAYAEFHDGAETFSASQEWTAPGVASIRDRVRRLEDFGPDIVAALRAGRPMVVDDVARDPNTAQHAAAYAALGVRANLAVPLMRANRLTAVLSVHADQPRHWTPQDITVTRDTAARTWAAVERGRVEQQLRAESEKLRIATEAANLGLFDHDLFTGQVDWSPLTFEHVGHPADRPIDRHSFLAAIHADDRPRVLDLLEQLYAGGGDGSIDVEYRTTDAQGRLRWISARGLVFYDAFGRAQRMVGVTQDTTQRKQAEQLLADANRRKDDFLAMLAHELRNPLAPISASAHILAKVARDEGRVLQVGEVLRRQVQHMTHLVDDLLDVSRVTRGLVELDRAPVDIGDLVGEAIEQAGPLIQSREHRTVLDLPPQRVMVWGDKKRLVQVLANLLNNAAKYTPPGGLLQVSANVRQGQVRIDVVDNGMGMGADMTEHAFELFTQAERTSDRALGGLGLGLALVKSLVELHGGTVACSSDGEGRGSRFTVFLPELDPARWQAPAPAGTAPTGKARKLRILVVDDNVDAADTLGLILSAEGHEVLVEHAPTQALARARSERPDVCLLDIGLPQMSGTELARHLRADPATSHAVLVALTGYGQAKDREATAAAGFRKHLVKPLDVAELEAILADVGQERDGLR